MDSIIGNLDDLNRSLGHRLINLQLGGFCAGEFTW
jgi:hypothetical protein